MLKTAILLVFLGAGSIVALGQHSTSARNEKQSSAGIQPASARALTVDKDETVSEAERLTRSGSNRWLAGDFVGAIEAFRKASEGEPKLYAAQYNLAVAYLSQGNYRLALDPLKRLLMVNPKSIELLQYLGRAYYEVKDFQNALKCFEQTAKLASRSSVGPNNLGYANLNLYQIGAAEEAFKKALEITPGYEPAIMGLCFTYGHAKNDALVMEFCTKARQLNPKDSAPNYFIGLAKFDAGEYAEALAFFLRARTLQPEAAPTYVAIGFTQYRLKNFKEALANFTRAIQLEPSEPALNGKGVSYVSLKKYSEAEESFRQALAVAPNSFQTRFNLGMVCLIREKRDCALRNYNFLKMFNPPLADRLFEKIVAGRVLDLRAGHEPDNSPRE
jgi:tetratricopeptide (TPR) repeat protein